MACETPVPQAASLLPRAPRFAVGPWRTDLQSAPAGRIKIRPTRLRFPSDFLCRLNDPRQRFGRCVPSPVAVPFLRTKPLASLLSTARSARLQQKAAARQRNPRPQRRTTRPKWPRSASGAAKIPRSCRTSDAAAGDPCRRSHALATPRGVIWRAGVYGVCRELSRADYEIDGVNR